MQNFKNLDVFEILITQKLLKCPKDPFLRSALISIHIAVLTHCQMNKNPCSNQEIQVLFEHGFKLENT